MVKRISLIILSVFITVGILSGCKINMNELVSEISSEPVSSSELYSKHEETDTETTADSADPDTETNLEKNIDSESKAPLDISNYKTMYVTGASEIDVIEDAKEGSKVIGSLPCGEGVSFINGVITEFSFVYSETLGSFGYINNVNLVDNLSDIAYGEVYYVKSDDTPFYTDQYGSEIIGSFSKNDMVTVLAKISGGIWRTIDKSGRVGYVSMSFLSEKKISFKAASSKTVSKIESKTESKIESKIESKPKSKAESKMESKLESKTESKSEPSVYIGVGEAPTSGYTVYTVDVDLGYLALRGLPSSDSEEIIGELYYGEQVYVIDTSGDYWYVYAPTVSMYGYVKGDYDYLYIAY